MRFTVTDEFACTPERLWEILEDGEFINRLEERTEQRRELVEEHADNGVCHRRIRWVSQRDIPGVMKKALGIERLEYEHVQRLDRAEGVMDWEVTTPFLSDRVDVTGTTRVVATQQGCRRAVEGQVQIRLPLMGKKMEAKLAGRLGDTERAAAAIVRELLAQAAES